MQVRARLNGNILTIRCDETRVTKILTNVLRYTRLRYLATWKERELNEGRPMQQDVIECFHQLTLDNVSFLRTTSGFLSRVTAALADSGYELEIRDVTPEEHKVRPTPCWEAVAHYDFRPGQREILQNSIEVPRGIIHWATGTGKTKVIEMLCQFYNKARILVVSRYGSTVDSIYDRLSPIVRGVGKHWSGGKARGTRVMVYTAGCLHKALQEKPWDIVLADEVHELATENTLALLGQFRYAKMIGMSANVNDRLDKADFELEGLFGLPFATKSYEDGVKDGDIVPIEVHWRSVAMRLNPAANLSGVMRDRYGIWRNEYRNKLIAADARLFPEEQVLITVKTLEHAASLKKLLPEFTMVYGGADLARLEELKRKDLVDDDFKPMPRELALQCRRQFATGELRKVIATSVWNRAVDFRELSVLIRAEGSPNKIDSTQIPGRLSRIHLGKRSGFLIDYEDQFDSGCGFRALQRRRNYASLKWIQYRESNPSHFRTTHGTDDTTTA